MTEQERLRALKALAKKYPMGTTLPNPFVWKNPLNSNSNGIRWTRKDLDQFELFRKQTKGGKR